MKVLTIVGARPQFIKSVPVSRELKKKNVEEILIHTGQHFDSNMSDIFFNQMEIKKPDYLLNINSLNHGAMTGQMLISIEEILINEMPDYVIVYGDTNSTLAGALASSKLNVKLVHVEAGLRSFNMRMPEEINRIITDRLSTLLFCPTDRAIKNLESEGFLDFKCNFIKSGDVMQDAILMFNKFAIKPQFEIPSEYILCTIHRQENTDNIIELISIIKALNILSENTKIILPLHPRTQKKISDFKLNANISDRIIIVDPIGYFEMIYLLKYSSIVITDSGGLQKEAFFCHKLCLTLRRETEWIELVENGFNIISGSDTSLILDGYNKLKLLEPDFSINLYGNGTASQKIVEILIQ